MFAIGLGPTEIAIIVCVIIVLFGAKRLPELGRSLGQGIKEFRHASKTLIEDDESEKKSEPPAEAKS